MANLRVHLDAPRDVGLALATAQSLARGLDERCGALLYAAPLTGEATVLGAHQHAGSALTPGVLAGALPVVRRTSGGVALFGGEGVLYVALCLREPSALTPCPPGKLLNRYARGVLGGLRTLGVQANYFGRDFVSAGAEPVSYIGWAVHPDGAARVESFVAFERVFTPPAAYDGYPARSEPPFRGRALTTLRASGADAALDAHAVLEAIAAGHERAFHAQREERPPSASERAAAEDGLAATALQAEPAGLRWSVPREEAIGFVTAGVTLDGEGRLAAVQLGGDFFQHDDCAQALQAELRGQAPTADAIGGALDRVYGRSPGLLEGVRTLRSLQDAVLGAASRAAGHLSDV
jgi:hypothetical protein